MQINTDAVLVSAPMTNAIDAHVLSPIQSPESLFADVKMVKVGEWSNVIFYPFELVLGPTCEF